MAKTSTIKAVVLGDVDNFKKGMKEVGESAEQAGDKVKRDLNDSFDDLGEGAGSAEQKFIGLSDTITGTADVMEGLRTGNVQVLAMGLADLAGAAEALWTSVGKVITGLWTKVTATAADTAATTTNTASTIGNRIATMASTVATKAWAAAQWVLNAALSANPIALVIIGIAALVAAIVLAWQHSETFRNIVTGAFNAVWGAMQAVWGWVSENFPKLLQILVWPFQRWLEINLAVMGAVKDGITGAKDWIVGKFNEIVGAVTGLPGRIAGAASGMWDGIKNSFRSVLNTVIGWWNNFSFTMPSIDTRIPGVGKIGGWTFSTPNIPMLAEGGLVKGGQGGTLALIGEGRSDELVMPLDRARGLGNNVSITLNVPAAANPVEVGREVQRVLNRYGRTAR